MNLDDPLMRQFSRLQNRALVVGVFLLVLTLAGGIHHWTAFFRSYLLGFVFWTGVSLGCMVILMIHHLVTGIWGFTLRRLLESGAKTLFLMAALAIPLMANLSQIYPWTKPGALGGDPMFDFKRFYLSMPFYLGRNVFYFAAWMLLVYFLVKWSREQDLTGNPATKDWLSRLSAPGLLFYGISITYASIDWVMSLEPKWFSTIYGMIFMVTEMLAAMSLVTVIIILLAERKPFSDVLTPRLFNDYGNLLLMMVMLWAYLSFSQYLIIWAGNLQDEIPWYMIRATHGWAGVAIGLIVLHFAAPFVLLLMRFIKRRRFWLGFVAALLFVMSVVDIYWLSVPAYEPKGPQFHLMDFGILFGFGGLWLSLFFSQMRKAALLPQHDPRWDAIKMHE